MKRIAIVITSQYGQTAKIADSMSDILQCLGHAVQVYRLKNWTDVAQVTTAGFDGVMIGGSVYGGNLSRYLTEWTYANEDKLNRMPVALFTVGLNPIDERIRARSEDVRVIESFLEHTCLRTKITASLIGSLDYTRYGILRKYLAKREWSPIGCPSDTSIDHELTDWRMVSDFVLEFESSVIKRLHV